jgi:hypothetical protein
LRGARRFTDNSRVRIEAATGDPEYPRNPKKACQPFKYSINENPRRQTGRSSRSKYFQKSEKKSLSGF